MIANDFVDIYLVQAVELGLSWVIERPLIVVAPTFSRYSIWQNTDKGVHV